MNDLAALAAVLDYAGGQGAEHLKAEVVHGATTKSQVGVTLPGSGLLGQPRDGAQAVTDGTQATPAALAASMATHAADKGVQLVVKGAS